MARATEGERVVRQLVWRRERPACPTREPAWLDAIALAGATLTATVGLSSIVAAVFGWAALATLWFLALWLCLFNAAWSWLGWPE